ncbi:WD40 repeat-like protein [Martensiomyces pterosporus]|nr:WD40 repeat-like protein [Martensiomyces pterosporus]
MFRQPPKDAEINQPPTDSVSDLAFSPVANLLAASSWDNQVRIWDIQNDGTSAGKAMYAHEGPALCCAWSRDGTKLVSGGADKAGRMLDTATGQSVQIAQHDDAIRCIKFIEAENSSPIIATGSWDKTLKYWDLRQQSPLAVVNLPERVYAMDCNHPLMVVATADRKLVVFDVNNPTTPFKTIDSMLKWQTRTVSCFTKKDGFAVGSIEGRVGVQYIDDKQRDKNFSFKCHRDTTIPSQNSVYAVNSISHHQGFGTFVTAGSDGSFVFWDKDARQKLKSYTGVGGPILSTAFNGDGKILAYAIGYDWSKGYQHNTDSVKNTILLHAVAEDDVKPRAK